MRAAAGKILAYRASKHLALAVLVAARGDFRKKIEEYEALKAAWTPGGVMICLPAVDLAVRLGQDLINTSRPSTNTSRT